jgi:uncharacterized coiled-coil protein SlyX
MELILSLLKNKIFIITAFCGISMIVFIFLYIKVLKSENESLTIKLSVAESSIKTLQTSISKQNTAIDKMKKDADDRLKENIKNVNKSKEERKIFDKHSKDLLSKKTPEDISKCDSANLLINEEIDNEPK